MKPVDSKGGSKTQSHRLHITVFAVVQTYFIEGKTLKRFSVFTVNKIDVTWDKTVFTVFKTDSTVFKTYFIVGKTGFTVVKIDSIVVKTYFIVVKTDSALSLK